MESLSDEGGRTVVKYQRQEGDVQTLTPKAYNVRTKANEYGGRAYIAAKDVIYFCNYKDQRIYRQALSANATPVALTKECANGQIIYYADLCLDKDEEFLFFVMETEDSVENKTEIGFIRIDKINQSPVILKTGSDFYASLSISADAKQLAWVEWDHPNMPWDNTRCRIADLAIEDDFIALNNTKTIIESATAAHTYFLGDGSLMLTIDWANHLTSDAKNYANLYRYQHHELKSVTQGFAEYSYPHWIFGNHRYAALNDHMIVAIATTPKGDELHLIDLDSFAISRVANEFCVFESICADQGVAYVIATSSKQSSQIIRVDLNGEIHTLNQANETFMSPDMISEAQFIEFTSSDNELVYANYYPACNSDYVQPDQAPPLIVMVHGGPTARANSGFDVLKQYWTSSGFALLDVNHRGSSGFGRQYRDALLGQWGKVDAMDIRDAILFAIDQKLAAAEAIFIRGKSAGGYAVQRALTEFPDIFKAGASYYGIGDLATLAEITHKFESHYCDSLLGEIFDATFAANQNSTYFIRSPIHFMDCIQCPMILFQGTEDKVVPPALSAQVVNMLEQQGVKYEYHLYEGEGHGFRKLASQVESIKHEMAFFRDAMSLSSKS